MHKHPRQTELLFILSKTILWSIHRNKFSNIDSWNSPRIKHHPVMVRQSILNQKMFPKKPEKKTIPKIRTLGYCVEFFRIWGGKFIVRSHKRILTKVVAILSGNSFAIIAKLAVKKAALPKASIIRMRNAKLMNHIWPSTKSNNLKIESLDKTPNRVIYYTRY